jgi:hypothetical protein
LVVTQPQFLFTRYIEKKLSVLVTASYDLGGASEQFGIIPDGKTDRISARFGDFESITIGGGKRSTSYHMPVTVKASAVSGSLEAIGPGVSNGDSAEVAGNLPNGCTIVFRVPAGGDALTFERIHATGQ